MKKRLSSVLSAVASEFGKTEYATSLTVKSNVTIVGIAVAGFHVRKAFFARKNFPFFLFLMWVGKFYD